MKKLVIAVCAVFSYALTFAHDAPVSGHVCRGGSHDRLCSLFVPEHIACTRDAILSAWDAIDLVKSMTIMPCYRTDYLFSQHIDDAVRAILIGAQGLSLLSSVCCECIRDHARDIDDVYESLRYLQESFNTVCLGKNISREEALFAKDLQLSLQALEQCKKQCALKRAIKMNR